ncbi:MAG TPA: ester cyclase [Dehalococcoidia bacterium]|nr:ester cyclase [Dehalococcoidia bacterium]
MSIEEENKATLLHFYELFNQNKPDKCNELVAPEFISHRTTGDISREDLIKGITMLFTAFPDFKATIEHLVAEGNMIAYREICIGTHKGEFMGIAPTRKRVEMINTSILKIIDGKWVEAWPTLDLMRLMQQLGAIPSQ